MKRVYVEEDGEFSIEVALQIYPTNQQIFLHNQKVPNHFKVKWIRMYTIQAQD